MISTTQYKTENLLGGGLVALAVGGLGKALTYLGDDIDSPNGPVATVSYAEFEKKARTGDLVLTSAPTSVTRMFTKSMWSHCGILFRDPASDAIYEWSSHMEAEEVMNTLGRNFGGMQLVPLYYLAADNGTVYWRRVHLSAQQRKRIHDLVERAKYQVEFSAYPELAAYLGPIWAKAFNGFGTGMVCSHTVAATYLHAEALELDRHLSQFSPETFSPSGDASWTVPVEDRVSMVVDFDMSKLISFRIQEKRKREEGDEGGLFSEPDRSPHRPRKTGKDFRVGRVPERRDIRAPMGQPKPEEVYAIQTAALNFALEESSSPGNAHENKQWDIVITSPSCRLQPQPQQRQPVCMRTLFRRAMLLYCLYDNYPTKLTVRETSARGETRIRGDNTWLLEKVVAGKIDQWMCAVLPRGKRFIVAIFGDDAECYFFDRTSLCRVDDEYTARYRRPECGAEPLIAVDAVLSAEGVVCAFDVICINGKSACHLTLPERMSLLPNTMKRVAYLPAADARRRAERMTRTSGERMLLVESAAQYRPGQRSAIIWRPPRGADVAVLCVRGGQAMAAAGGGGDECLLASAGPILSSPPPSADGGYDHMGCYACKYAGGGWTLIERAKRKEPLATYQQVQQIKDGTRVVSDTFVIFPSPVTKK